MYGRALFVVFTAFLLAVVLRRFGFDSSPAQIETEERQMVNKNSIYTLNKKNPDAIVYPSATGKPIVITRDDFPSEEEFLAFKKWSDENVH